MAPNQPPGAEDPSASFGTVGDGRYRMTARLGRGGMAEVLLAEDVRLGRPVAIKLLRADLSQDEVARQRFTREAQAVAGLNHHAVVAVYDTGEDLVNGEMVPFIVMELVEGKTIRDLLIDAEEPPVEQALIVTSGVLEALGYSHRMGIVHRDIKPANVIITNTGAVKVMDFGIARALGGGASTMTQTGMVMGTPQYLSPEQALGKGVDARSDLYATGCLLYELLTLRPPFTGETPLAVVYQHVQDPPVPPSQANPRVPPELDALVLRALAKNPDERFQSADEMRGALQHALLELTGETGMLGGTGAMAVMPVTGPGGTPVAGTQMGPTGSTGRVETPVGNGAPVVLDDGEPPRRRGKAVAAVLLLLAVIAAISVGIWIASNNTKDKTPPENTPPPSTSKSAPSKTPSKTPEKTRSETPPPSRTQQQPSTPQNTATGGTPSTPTTPPTEPSSPATSPSTGGQDGGNDGDNEGQDGGNEGDDGGSSDGQDPTDQPTDGASEPEENTFGGPGEAAAG